MDEHVVKLFTKEEEFLDEFGDTAATAARTVNNEWIPNYYASDAVRANIKYFLSSGEVKDLTFTSASVYHEHKVFSSVQIVLKSSFREVTIRVRRVGNELVGEKIRDKGIDTANN
ncbi:MAG: hypothetical protein ACYCZF_09160 [Anaerolineae bacterium]